MDHEISSDAIRAAVSATLDGDPEVKTVLQNRVAFRDISAFSTFPFLAIGHAYDRADPTAHDQQHLVTVNIWLRPGEERAARKLIRILRRALDEARLAIPGAHVMAFKHERSSVRPAPELDALHATVRYRLVLDAKTKKTRKRATTP
ncbi:DUF3168 domain-containing protein [Leptospira interrogans]